MFFPEITPTDPVVRLKVQQHDLSNPHFMHTNLEVGLCVCTHPDPNIRLGQQVLRPPSMSGSTCIDCGGMMVRTGTCETCTECGSTGGCG